MADLSFISLRTVAPALLGLAAPGADLVLLVKPQFEAGRAEASRHQGVIRDPEVWARVLDEVVAAYAEAGAGLQGLMVSPLRGPRATSSSSPTSWPAARPPPTADRSTSTGVVADAAVADGDVAEAEG